MDHKKLSVTAECQLAVMRELGQFTRYDVMRKLDVSRTHGQTMVNRLRRKGYVEEIGFTEGRLKKRLKVFQVTSKPIDLALPARQKIWNTLRICRAFTKPEVCAAADVSMALVSRYVNELIRWGYVRKVNNGRPGEVAGYARYRLLRNTGPDYPRVAPQTCSDPNTGEVRKVEAESCNG